MKWQDLIIDGYGRVLESLEPALAFNLGWLYSLLLDAKGGCPSPIPAGNTD
jgi:hypothetical protein